MLKLPDSICIAGINWSVEITDDVDAAWGECDFNEFTIKLHEKMFEEEGDDTFALSVFIHEVVHAVFWTVPVLKKAVESVGEEAFIDTFASVFSDTLMRNELIKMESFYDRKTN